MFRRIVARLSKIQLNRAAPVFWLNFPPPAAFRRRGDAASGSELGCEANFELPVSPLILSSEYGTGCANFNQ